MSDDDWYNREYAKQEGRERAREDAARRRAGGRTAGGKAGLSLGCLLILFGVPAFACVSLAVLGIILQATGVRPQTTHATTTHATTPATEPPLPPTTRPTPPAPPPTPKADPPKAPTVTLTPPKGDVIPLGSSKYVASTAAKTPEVRAKWLKDGELLLLSEPTSAEVMSRDRDYCRVKVGGKEWWVETKHVPAK